MSETSLFDRAEAAAAVVRKTHATLPRTAVVLGSGLGSLVDRLTERVEIPYTALPHFPRTTVEGHHGNLIVGSLGSAPVFLLQGRFHYYEGHDLDAVVFPVRVLQRLGVTTLVLTAATGGVSTDLIPGDIVCVADHLNLLGANPLRGRNDDRFGTRFPDMTEVYSARLRGIARAEAEAIGLSLPAGVYACLPGPSYETPAEIRMLRTLGADVVGMSTVPEAIAARHAGMEVIALALVSNMAAGVVGTPITHEEVLEAGRLAGPRLGALIERVVKRVAVEVRVGDH
ncbi:MAG: purine-nucleoside phosphorylase [Isosphaeraceae bacterium]|nr:purine-nucleoside phosphorylase [Isosphaeraceae bacterium]